MDLLVCFWQQVIYFEVAHPDTNPTGEGLTSVNFCSGTVRCSEHTLKPAVKKELNFMSASKPMFLLFHSFPSIFLGLVFYV